MRCKADDTGRRCVLWRVHIAARLCGRFVMVLVFTSVISAHLRSILLLHLMIFAVMTAVGFLLSHVILVYLRKTLMGLQPEELLSRYLQQDEVLGAMAEDLVASDTAGNILFANAAARKIIGGDRKMPALRKRKHGRGVGL